MNKANIITVVIAVVVSLLVVSFAVPKSGGSKESAYERVVKTRILRCAYAEYPPTLTIEPNTRALSGIFPDMLEEFGKRAGIKIEWTEEVGWGTINQGFITGRYDAFCAGLWPSASRSVTTLFTRPIFYDPISAFVRTDDTRFDNNWQKANAPEYKITATLGDASATMADALFPNAQRFLGTETQSIADIINDVVAGKADITIRDLISADMYLRSNPGKIRDISPGKPLLMYPIVVGLGSGEHDLKNMLDAGIYELQNDGTVEKLIKKHMGDKASLFSQEVREFKAFE